MNSVNNNNNDNVSLQNWQVNNDSGLLQEWRVDDDKFDNNKNKVCLLLKKWG